MKLNSVLILLLSSCANARNGESIVVITLPRPVSEVAPSLEKGREILSGALSAIESINGDPGLLQGTSLVPVLANSGRLLSNNEPYSGEVLELVANLTWHNKSVIGVTGLLHHSVISALQAFQLPIVPLIHFGTKTVYSPNVLYMTASGAVLTDAMLAFLTVVNQTEIGVITENCHSHYSRVSNRLFANANVTMYVQLGCNRDRYSSEVFSSISLSNVHVLFLSVSPTTAIHVLCDAHIKGLQWPNYAWIMYGYRLDDLLELQGARQLCINKSESNIFDGIVVFQSFREYTENETTEKGNPFALLLHDAVYALASLADGKLDACSSILSEQNSVFIYQSLGLLPKLIGIYSGTSNTLVNISIGKLVIEDPVFVRKLLPLYFISLPLLCFIFNTALLILYVCFRKDPNVKSTSISLSLILFVGCYLLIVYTIILVVNVPLTFDICMVHGWLGGVGLSMQMILATILVKMLRVYHIFSLRKIMKPRLYTSNFAHFLYTALVLSPNVAILILWTTIDPYHRDDTYVRQSDFTVTIIEDCQCTYPNVWFALLFVCSFLLAFAVVVVAFKSRKIRLAQFKDTKKVNLLIFLIIFIGCSTFGYWYIFSITDNHRITSTYILFAGHIIAAFVTQFTLFVPKVWPPFIKIFHLSKRA